MSSYASPGSLIALSVSLMILGLAAACLRFRIRRLQKASFLLDDWSILSSLILFIGMAVTLIIGVKGHGDGYEVPESSSTLDTISSQQILTAKVEYAITILSSAQLGLAKLSILYFYRRVFCTSSHNRISGAIYIMIGLVITWIFIFTLLLIFKCGGDVSLNWDSDEAQLSTCVDLAAINEGWTGSDFAMDMIIFFLPIPSIWKLRLPLSKRLAVIAVFTLGALTIVASFLRLIIIILLANEKTTGILANDPDILSSVDVFWVVLEGGLAIIVACLPTLNYLTSTYPSLIRSQQSMISFPLQRRTQSQFRVIEDNSNITE